MFRRNVPASRFCSKRGSRCPGSQSQGANTPSFWLFGSWSNVETQSIPQFAKKNFISRSVYGSWLAGCQNRPLVQWICTGLQICKRRFNPLYRATEFFLHFLTLDSATHRSFLHFLSLNLQKKFSSLGLYMVLGQQYVRTGHWSSGYARDYRSASVGSIPSTGLSKFFCTFCHLALPPTEVFCTFCHSICKKKKAVLFFPRQKQV